MSRFDLDPATPLLLVMEGEEHPTTFAEMVRENEFTDEEASAIANDLLGNGVYVGGGGAQPWYELRTRV